jgi:hypothetical protein
MRTRAHIRLETRKDIFDFLSLMTSLQDFYYIENSTGEIRIEASSMLGVVYATADFGEEMYLVNNTNDGDFPAQLNKYRV